MSHIKVEVKKEHTANVYLTPPLFWRNPTTSYYEYLGLLDDKTVVYILILPDWVCIKNGSPESLKSELNIAHKNFDVSTEAVFFSAFDEAYESMRLTPEIRETAGEYHEREEKELIPLENNVS